LLKAKYCPQVAAASWTQKKTKNPCELDLETEILEVFDVYVHAKLMQIYRVGHKKTVPLHVS